MTQESEALVEEVAKALAMDEMIQCEPGECEDCDSWRQLAGRAITVARPLIQAQVLRDMYESTKADHLIAFPPRPSKFVKDYAKKHYGIDL